MTHTIFDDIDNIAKASEYDKIKAENERLNIMGGKLELENEALTIQNAHLRKAIEEAINELTKYEFLEDIPRTSIVEDLKKALEGEKEIVK